MNEPDPPDKVPDFDPGPGVPAVSNAGRLGAALPAEDIKVPEKITAAQGKIEAVAALTMKAYDRAGTLELTAEQSEALQTPFPDEAFRPGAAGKESLIYLEHSALRDRFNKVLGLGQWSIVVRNRWAEEFDFYSKTDRCMEKGTRVYCEAMLVVHGCFVGEAVGSMNYFPNEATDFSDAAEGAKTAAFRRCAKEFGVGLQAWSKEWCDGWWARRNERRRPAAAPPAPAPSAPSPKPAPTIPEPPEQKHKRWITLLREAGGGRDEYAHDWCVEQGILLPTETLDDYPLSKLPKSQAIARGILDKIRARSGAAQAPPPPANAAPDEEWRAFPMPFGKNAGTPLGNLAKNYLFGLWVNFKVETEWKGKPRHPAKIAADRKFRAMLDAAGKHYAFVVRSEVDEPAEPEPPPPDPVAHAQNTSEDDDIPF